ncbi:hypothetical protein U1Q18_050046, partial [Sarracenia purpurea var. burkii]
VDQHADLIKLLATMVFVLKDLRDAMEDEIALEEKMKTAVGNGKNQMFAYPANFDVATDTAFHL